MPHQALEKTRTGIRLLKSIRLKAKTRSIGSLLGLLAVAELAGLLRHPLGFRRRVGCITRLLGLLSVPELARLLVNFIRAQTQRRTDLGSIQRLYCTKLPGLFQRTGFVQVKPGSFCQGVQV